MSAQWHSYASVELAAEACARHIFAKLEEALSGERDATLAVSGGSTPKLMFDSMIQTRFEWERVHLFFVDERVVPVTSPESNFKLANEHLIVPAHIPARNVHRVHTELRPEAAAARYADEIKEYFGLADGAAPHFDVIHQGMGPEAHTASLFPGEPLIEDRESIAGAVWVEKVSQWRVTLLPAVLVAAHHTVVLAGGEDKAEAVRAVFQEPYQPLKYPAQMVAHHGRAVTWFLDSAAARLLE